MGFLIDLFKKKKPLDIVSTNPNVLASARARATLPQAQIGIRGATAQGVLGGSLSRFSSETSTVGQVLGGATRAFGGQANVRTAARTAPEAFGQFIQPLSSQALRIKKPIHGISRASQYFGGPEVTYGQGIKFFSEEFAKFPVRMGASTISTVALLHDLSQGKEVRPQDLLASSGTFFEGYLDSISPGAAKTTLVVGAKNFKKPVWKLLLSSRMAQNIGIGGGAGLSIGLQDNVDAKTVGNQVVNSLPNAAIGAILAGTISSVLQISGKGAGGIKKAIIREVKDSFRLVKGKAVPRPRRVYNTQSGKPGQFRNENYRQQAKDIKKKIDKQGGFIGRKPTEEEIYQKLLKDNGVQPDNITTSIQQAKASGQSFDEWVEGQGETVYHGTNTKFDIFNKNKIGEVTGRGDWGDGFYFSDRKSTAKSFAKDAGGDIVMEIKLSNLKFADGNKLEKLPEIQDILDDGMGFTDMGEYLKKKGYDGVKYKHAGDGGIEYVVYDPSKIKTRSQLKAEWDKVSGKVDDITTSIKTAKASGQSFDEWVNAKQPNKEYITVYHRTNTPIEDFGKTPIYSKENKNEFFVSNKKTGQVEGYGKNVVELRVKKSDLTINDEFPSGEKHYTLNTKKADEALKTRSQLKAEWDKFSSQAGFFRPGEIVAVLGRLVGLGKQVSPDVSSTKSTIGVVPPAKVGNLNMSRLGVSPNLKNDINTFLTKHTDTGDNPISFSEIEKMAGELGLTPADITQVYEEAGGKLSAKILALRRMEIDAVRQATNAAKKVDPNNPKSVKEYQKLVNKVVNIANARKERVAETGRALAAQKIEAGESRNAMQALLEVAKKVDPNNKYQQEQLGQLINEAAKPTFWDKLAEFAAATKLTSIKSVERNWIGNITAPIYDPIKKLLAGTIDAATKGITGGKRVNFASEAIHDVAGTFSAVPRGTKNFLKALVLEEFETGATVDIGRTGRGGAIGGTVGKIIRTPFRLMNDQFFYTIAEERARRSLAHRAVKLRGATGQTAEAIYRQYYESPPVKLHAQIQREAKEAVYREDLGAFSSKLKQALDALPFRMGKIITPFYTTPTNILRKFAREKSAIGLISKRNWDDIKAGGAARNEAIAKMMMGSTITFGAMGLAFRGLVTGRGPRDPAERDLLYQSGWQPYSYWTGKGWRSYSNLGEITLVLGTAADIAEVVKESKEEGDVKAGDMFARSAIIAGNSIFNQSFFTGISDAMNAVADAGYSGDPTKQASRFAANLISGIVTPSAVRQVASGTDVLRKPEGIVQQVISTIPGLRERLPEKLTQFGDEIRVSENVTDAMLNPMKYTELKDDIVVQELIRLDTRVGFPSRNQINVPMSQETYRDFTKIAGQETKNILEAMFKDPQYQQASDEEKKEAVKTIRDDIRDRVREGLAGEILIGGITDRRIKNTERGWVNAMFNELINSKDWRSASQEERELVVQDIADQLDLEGVLEPELFDFIKYLR